MIRKRLFLIDGHSQLFKAFFAVRNLSTPDGMPANAVFGFVQIINRIITEYAPEYLCVCFDLPGKTFRNDIYPAYKANRPPAPEDLNIQTPVAKEFVKLRGIQTLEMENYESDDLLVTMARRAVTEGFEVFIVTLDKDLLQVVGDGISVIRMTKNDFELVDRDWVVKKYGVDPERMADFQGLVGDSTDNIPGAPGIGQKTAPKLLQGFESLEDMFDRLDEIKNPKQKEKLATHKDQILMSKRLATLVDTVPVDLTIADCAFDDKPSAELLAFYTKMGFTRHRDATRKALGLKEGEVEAMAAAMSSVVASGGDGTPVQTETTVIWDRAELEAVAQGIRAAGRVAVDTETTSTNALACDLVGISLAWEPGRAVYIPVGHDGLSVDRPQLELETVGRTLGPVLADSSIEKIAQNAKYDLHVLARHGMPIEGLAFDTMVASYLADPDARHGLKSLCVQWLGETMTPIEDLIGTGKAAITMDRVPVTAAAPYAGADADVTLRLREPLARALEEAGLLRIFEEVEMPLISVLAAMERRGVGVDVAYLERFGREMDEQMEALTAQAHEAAGHPFNLDSPSQLATVLFEELKLPAGKRGRTGYSTDVSVLQDLQNTHPLPKLMLEYRERRKLRSTYIDGLSRLVDPSTGRVHTSFNQTIAATGRLSSSDPNLQNIPARTALGLRIREGFTPTQSDRVFLAADYSQIELRILAHVTEEPALVQAFKEGRDIHRLTASKIFDVSEEAVTKEQRSQAKTVNFGVIYGMSPAHLSRELGIGMGKAAAFIKDYFAVYPGVKSWSRDVVAEARERGYVTTLLGRRRYLPNLNSESPQVRANAERIAVNTPIQGTAADMIKVAMLRVEERLADENLDAVMLMQVHDELIFEVHEDVVEAVRALVIDEMSEALPLSVPVSVDSEVGRNWSEC